MKKLMIAAVLGATVLTGTPAAAQTYNDELRRYAEDRAIYEQQLREYRRQNRQYRRAQRTGDWRSYRQYDHNRADPVYGGYYANRYYRGGRYYRPIQLRNDDRVYRGNDGRYYCRRSDGTTGLIAGAAVGGLLGNILSPGGSGILGTLIGAGAGAAVGTSIEQGSNRNNVTCR